ncbi:hypothetical protein HPY86_08670 [candidate division WOR-3 bacterium]|nr:hypothetical protein [candidate division WOR-3 bacterium]
MVKHKLFYLTVLALATILGCSEAPLIEREANRVVFLELFSTLPDE